MEPYRIKHKPSGLYYKPGEVNLSKSGKVYFTKNNVFSYDGYGHDTVHVSLTFDSPAHKLLKQMYEWEPSCVRRKSVVTKIPKDDFELEPIK